MKRSSRPARLASAVLAAAVGAGTVTGCVVPPPPARSVRPPVTSLLRADSVERHSRQVTVRLRSVRCHTTVTGSGFVVGDHTIVTNRHVAGSSVHLDVDTWDGLSYRATSVATSGTVDLALVTVRQTLRVHAQLRDRPLSKGDPVTAVGYPLGNQIRFEQGRFAGAVDGSVYDQPGPVDQLTMQVQPGNSGGPVLDSRGRVAGVVFAQVRATEAGLALDLATLRDFLAEGGEPDHVTC